MARRRHNPRGDGILNLITVLGLAGVAYLAYQANPSRFKNILSGQPTYLPNGIANPQAAPFATDTGYTTSSYGSGAI